MDLLQEVARAKNDPAFLEIHGAFANANVMSWLTEDEKALHFAIGAYGASGGHVVEIGSYQGGSACFLGAGIRARGHGRLTCIDPHLGGPTWLGMAPYQRTLKIFLEGMNHCGLTDWVEPRVGDSVAVAAVWPNQPVDAVFIDGDHSFSGALKDFECWGPKVSPGGYIMIDDADDPCLPELLEMINFVRTLDSVEYLGTIDGIAVLRKRDVDGWVMLEELGKALAGRGIHRPWDWSYMHQMDLPANYLKSKSWKEAVFDTTYQLCFLARCGPGLYGYTSALPRADRAVPKALSADRGDGAVIEIGGKGERLRDFLRQPKPQFRAIFCRPEEAKSHAHRLLPGGVLIAHQHEIRDITYSLDVRQELLSAGLEGCGFGDGMHWGVWQPHYLASDAIIDFAAC